MPAGDPVNEVVHLMPKPLAVLECLRQAGGEVVTRDQLFEQVWPGGVVSDATLTQCIVELRRAFGAALAVALLAFGAWWYPHDDAVSVSDSSVQDSVLETSIAVLPFVNMSDEPGNEYFADGLSEELQNMLAKIPQLKVSARTSSFAFRNKDVTVAEIASALNVAHLLEGSVRKTGDRIRISVQLIEAKSGFELWSESYDRTLDDIFAVQDDVATSVVESLRIRLVKEPPPMRETNSEVYSLYLQALYLYQQSDARGPGQGIEKIAGGPGVGPELCTRNRAPRHRLCDAVEQGRKAV